jgi:hypothetical protein
MACALVVEREAVGLHVVVRDISGLSTLVKTMNGGGDARVGLEDARGEVDDRRLELVVVDEVPGAGAAWALVEPKSTPSGTIAAERPPCLSMRRMRARKSSSVLRVLTVRSSDGLAIGLVIEACP